MNINSQLPADYEECGTCGYDHDYEYPKAYTAHLKLIDEEESQPKWKVVTKTNRDLLLEDTTGVYSPELEHAEEYTDNGKVVFNLYRVSLDKMTMGEDGRLVDVVDAQGIPHVVWFENDRHEFPLCQQDKPGYCECCKCYVSIHKFDSACACSGESPEDVRKWFCSDDIQELLRAYIVIASYHGWENFDSPPLQKTEEEFDERWNRIVGYTSTT